MDSLFFSNPIGLGHITRDIAITQYFDKPPTFVTGSQAANFLKKMNLDLLDLYTPPPLPIKNGKLDHSLRWLWQYYQYYKNCKAIAKKIITSKKLSSITTTTNNNNNSTIVISDEDFASLTAAQQQNIPNVLITDILETRFTHGPASIIEKRMNTSMKKIISKCDAVIYTESNPSPSTIVDETTPQNIQKVGPIVRTTPHTREQLRKQFGFDDNDNNKKIVIVSVGGTDAGLFLIQKTIEAITKIKNDDYRLVTVSGPSIPTSSFMSQSDMYSNKNKNNNIYHLGFIDNLHEAIYASDLVIALAGKSTIDETNAYGTPGIFIPVKNHFEQEDNAKKQGYTHSDVFRLANLIEEKIALPRNPIHCDGAKKAYDIITNVLDEK